MVVSIQVDPGTGVAIVVSTGALRAEDARESAEALWKTPGWSGRAAVWDFRAARFEVSPSDTREVAGFILAHQPTPPPSKVAVVTQRNVDFGMARMFGAFRDDPGTVFRVFRDYDEAIRWAGAPDPGPAE